MEKPKRSPWIIILIIVLVLICLCLCALVVGGGAAYLLSGSNTLPENLEFNLGGDQPQDTPPLPTKSPAQAAVPTAIQEQPSEAEPALTVPIPRKPTAVKTPTEVVELEDPETEPPAEASAPTGKQERTENRIFDDFSSGYMGWAIDKDEYVDLQIINGAYSIHNLTPDDMEWVYFPVDFRPHEIKFDVKGPSGKQDGTYGVMCQYIDKQNYYYVEIDLSNNSYTIAELVDDTNIPLTKENSSGQYWYQVKSMKTPPTSTNKIAVSCYPDSITLFVNNKLVDQVNVKTPITEDGRGAIFVYTYNFADENGYQVLFDNVEIYQPVQ